MSVVSAVIVLPGKNNTFVDTYFMVGLGAIGGLKGADGFSIATK